MTDEDQKLLKKWWPDIDGREKPLSADGRNILVEAIVAASWDQYLQYTVKHILPMARRLEAQAKRIEELEATVARLQRVASPVWSEPLLEPDDPIRCCICRNGALFADAADEGWVRTGNGWYCGAHGPESEADGE